MSGWAGDRRGGRVRVKVTTFEFRLSSVMVGATESRIRTSFTRVTGCVMYEELPHPIWFGGFVPSGKRCTAPTTSSLLSHPLRMHECAARGEPPKNRLK